MKTILLSSLSFAVLFTAISPAADAQWVKNNGPFYGYFYGVAVIGTDLFAGGGSGGGMYRSTDSGASWTNVSQGWDISCLTVCGTNLIAGSSVGILLSTDNGTSWASVNPGIYATCFAVNGTNILAGTNSWVVFLSTNSGVSWTALNTGPYLGNRSIVAVALNGTSLFAVPSQDVGYASYDGVFLSTDNGASWNRVSSGLPDLVSAIAVSGGISLRALNITAFFVPPTTAQTGLSLIRD